ncbi:uncharacterized protein LOC134826030 [Bolinopsis microptera]|uniref:uncharacterized protein LOC134826030 n=1 Tax=Bolinopsis microptera TaxID=2820187 RepID=UPI003078DB41
MRIKMSFTFFAVWSSICWELSTGFEASPSSTPGNLVTSTPWTQAKNTTSPTATVSVVTEKAPDTPTQRPDPTTWNQHPPEKSPGPLGAVGDEEKCWNFLAGVYSEQGRCGDQPSCCFQSGATNVFWTKSQGC